MTRGEVGILFFFLFVLQKTHFSKKLVSNNAKLLSFVSESSIRSVTMEKPLNVNDLML